MVGKEGMYLACQCGQGVGGGGEGKGQLGAAGGQVGKGGGVAAAACVAATRGRLVGGVGGRGRKQPST